MALLTYVIIFILVILNHVLIDRDVLDYFYPVFRIIRINFIVARSPYCFSPVMLDNNVSSPLATG